tara:strand:+ start:67 stop:240 length:174 start_codon:yes stop_codon:yes gene_type:complete
MSTTEAIQAPKQIAESIRRLDSKKLAELVSALCEDNMGKKLQTALGFEILDKDLNKE